MESNLETPIAESTPLAPNPLVARIVESVIYFAFPIHDLIEYPPQDEPEGLLGRPGQYVAKVTWIDDRSEPQIVVVEIFSTQAEVSARQQALQDRIEFQVAHPSLPMLLRMPPRMRSGVRQDYETWFTRFS